MSMGTIVGVLMPASLVLAAPAPADGLMPTPSGIYNGEEVGYCEWPAVVAMRQAGAIRCTSTLISPRVVLTARHCLEAIGGPNTTAFEFVFGEHSDDAARAISPSFCASHPSNDLGFCVLPQPVTDVQYIPPIAGCELEELWPGREITILGFGSSFASQNEEGNWDIITGQGPKRFTSQFVEKVEDGVLYLVGDDSGGCPGDSGGPAMVRASDGSWRTLGSAWAIHPDTPPKELGENICGYGTLYTMVSPNLAWIETESGQDVTPCHDAQGNWDPGPRCQRFPISPDIGFGAWETGCYNPEVSDWGSTCGPPWEDPLPPEPEPPEPEPPEPEPEPPEPESTTGDDPFAGETGFGDLESEFDGISARGCDCDVDPRRGSPLAGLLVLLWARRRRS
jgi:hypothetical protein